MLFQGMTRKRLDGYKKLKLLEIKGHGNFEITYCLVRKLYLKFYTKFF